MKIYLAILLITLSAFGLSQSEYYGTVKESAFNTEVPFAKIQVYNSDSTKLIHTVMTDEYGRFNFKTSEKSILIVISTSFLDPFSFRPSASGNMGTLLFDNAKSLKLVEIYYENPFETGAMKTIEGVTITSGKKTQKIYMKNLSGNKATNNSREIYSKVPGLNIWESDGGGLQLGLGTRGLSPSRSAHINTRQNGYDISADPLGYPESYYTPPVQSLKSINFIRGASSLQFGPQFGGMVNFVMKDPSSKPFEYNGAHTYGAYNLFSTYNQFSGTLGKRFNYFGYGLYKRGDGWRDNSGFEQVNGFLRLSYYFNENIAIGLEHTYMSYTAQQAGGLTDALFNEDPRQSIRSRNWFNVNWNITAFDFYWNISNKSAISWKTYSVRADRSALGNLDKISRTDDLEDRDLIFGEFKNIGSELRWLKRYPIGNKVFGAFSAGLRYYQGITLSQQGKASNGYDANFTFNNPNDLEGSNYEFPSQNAAVYFENMINFNGKLSVTFGGRLEYINTKSDGFFREMIYHPLTNELLLDTTFFENNSKSRSFLLLGTGLTYALNKSLIYANIAQSYRAINFSDLRIVNPNQQVDENMEDEKGFNADIGLRGQNRKYNYDISGFFLYYNNKIGVVNTSIASETIRLRTNVGLAYSTGVEVFGERKFYVKDSSNHFISIFGNLSLVHARYGKLNDATIAGNRIEQVPPFMIRSGIKYQNKKLKLGILGAYIHEHFTDASNAVFDPNAVAGLIPSYFVLDFSSAYTFNDHFGVSAGVNNFTNNKYFTRRASGYPGPGIIPAEGITAYVTLSVNF